MRPSGSSYQTSSEGSKKPAAKPEPGKCFKLLMLISAEKKQQPTAMTNWAASFGCWEEESKDNRWSDECWFSFYPAGGNISSSYAWREDETVADKTTVCD